MKTFTVVLNYAGPTEVIVRQAAQSIGKAADLAIDMINIDEELLTTVTVEGIDKNE